LPAFSWLRRWASISSTSKEHLGDSRSFTVAAAVDAVLLIATIAICTESIHPLFAEQEQSAPSLREEKLVAFAP
jgi:hypothetical protein